jgi:hypothetical protein
MPRVQVKIGRASPVVAKAMMDERPAYPALLRMHCRRVASLFPS